MAMWWSDSNNWDLHAVVRGCSSSATVDPFSSFPAPLLLKEDPSLSSFDAEHDDYGLVSFPHLAAATENVLYELEELCKPFFTKPEEPVIRSTMSPERSSPCPQHQETRPLQPRPPTSRRRKNQQKKVVCEVPANCASAADLWAWRKYGQKPIKGSPYPRGYYRCSSSKGCMARKQVERSRTDPSTLVITYTAEHDHPLPTHRNSLAGSTRNKFPPSPSPPLMSAAAVELSPRTPLMASMEEELMGYDDMEEFCKDGDPTAFDSYNDDFDKCFVST